MSSGPFATYALVVCSLLAPMEARAQDATFADVAAMGDAAVAHPRNNSLITVNPGGMGLVDQFDVELGFTGGFDRAWSWHVSAIDGRTNDYVKFGLDYNGQIHFPPFLQSELPGWNPIGDALLNKREDHDITFALAVPVLDRRLSFGVNGTLSVLQGRYIDQVITGNMDIGVSTMPIPQLSVGFVAKSFLPVKDQARTPGSVAFGLRGMLPDRFAATFEAEYRYEDVQRRPWVLRGGLEGIIREVVAIRGGWNWDGDRANHQLSWGLGLVKKDVGSLSYAMQIPVIPHLRGLEIGHFLTLTLHTNVASSAEDEPIRWDDQGY